MRDNQTLSGKRGQCFVVMGFGIKTDYATGRKLDLNKSYRLLIKPVVEEKGLVCTRADEIIHAGSIDVHMYRELLKADVVIADLSTANVNAFYELGIRHALRAQTTIVISEDKLAYPFDLNHIKITSYTHLGEGIEYEEVERFRKVLGETLQSVLDKREPDSPVYTYLDGLIPPLLEEQIEEKVRQHNHHEEGEGDDGDVKVLSRKPKVKQNKTLALLIEQGEDAIDRKEYVKARKLFDSALLLGMDGAESHSLSNDPYLIQRLTLATYKSQKPDAITALSDALKILGQLDLEHTNDPETVTLAGAIEKNFYELGQGDEHLNNAILFFQRGYYLLNNRYNCVNLAYMQNCRANSSLCSTKEEQIADMVYANHTRRRVLQVCENDWNDIIRREERLTKTMADNDVLQKQKDYITGQKFWIHVNKAEAFFALGEFDNYKKSVEAAKQIEHKPWMMESFEFQLAKLRVLLQRNGHLLNPPWKEIN
ncbi:tetratricopeptide repeat-containing protein [Terrimonas pollutisoli]|uniref:tetratricopeptide repeat-containing protein n=1 Tax=Terrimonas pollutisoli TaxID=3034147 RepID=UPI0023ECEAD5|nr:tetratricopeptide repeat-containing protein [Terrimonas sp. H1YJ31]